MDPITATAEQVLEKNEQTRMTFTRVSTITSPYLVERPGLPTTTEEFDNDFVEEVIAEGTNVTSHERDESGNVTRIVIKYPWHEDFTHTVKVVYTAAGGK